MKLKPCPFCQSDDLGIACDGPQYYFVLCNHCYCRGSSSGTIEDAAKYWNDRGGIDG